jgi:hypothetical protein
MRANIKLVRGHVAALRIALLSHTPEPIERCLPRLVDAAGCLGMIEQELRARRPGRADAQSIQDLNVLKGELRAVHKLIEHGAKFYQGWANLLSAATSDYTRAGEAAPLSAAGTISIRG